MSRARSPEEQDVLLERTFSSRGFRVGLGLVGAGGLTALVGLGDLITDSNDKAEVMIAGGYVALTVGAGLAVVSGIRAVNNYDNEAR